MEKSLEKSIMDILQVDLRTIAQILRNVRLAEIAVDQDSRAPWLPREANSEGGVLPAIFGTVVMTLSTVCTQRYCSMLSRMAVITARAWLRSSGSWNN